MLDVLKKDSVHESLVKISAYVLSEFGSLIASEPGKGYAEQFDLVFKKMSNCSLSSQAVILTAFIKMQKNSP